MSAEDSQLDEPLAGFSEAVQKRFKAMSVVCAPECRLSSSDGEEFPVHKLKLVEVSGVLGHVPNSMMCISARLTLTRGLLSCTLFIICRNSSDDCVVLYHKSAICMHAGTSRAQ